MKIRFVMWDWKGQIDIEWLNKALADVFTGEHLPSVTEIDTGGDNYALVVGSDPLTKDEAQAIWRSCEDLEDDKHPYNVMVEIDLQKAAKTAAAKQKNEQTEKQRQAKVRRAALKKLSPRERKALNLSD